MERSVLDITLDLQRSLPGTVTVNRGDTHRTLRFYLSDGGRPYPVTDLRAVLTACKPDGSRLFNDCTVASDRILYDLTPQTTACPGTVECQLRLYGKEGELLNTAAFSLWVEDTVCDDDETITSAGEVSALTKLMTEADEKLQKMEAVLENVPNHAIIDDSRLGADALSGKKIADLFCPGFTAEGPAALCTPLEGYPLEVVSQLAPGDQGQLCLKQSGKNILDVATAGVYHCNPAVYWCDVHVTETGIRMEPIKESSNIWSVCGFYLGTTKELAGKTITLSARVSTSITATQLPWLRLAATDRNPTDVRHNPTNSTGGYIYGGISLKHSGKHDGYAVATYTVTGEEGLPYIAALFPISYGGNCVPGDWTQWSDIQVELRDTPTEYAPYRGATYTADLTNAPQIGEGGSYNWTTGVVFDGTDYYAHEPGDTFRLLEGETDKALRYIPGLPGENTFYTGSGTTCVTGRADIRSLLEKLQ